MMRRHALAEGDDDASKKRKIIQDLEAREKKDLKEIEQREIHDIKEVHAARIQADDVKEKEAMKRLKKEEQASEKAIEHEKERNLKEARHQSLNDLQKLQGKAMKAEEASKKKALEEEEKDKQHELNIVHDELAQSNANPNEKAAGHHHVNHFASVDAHGAVLSQSIEFRSSQLDDQEVANVASAALHHEPEQTPKGCEDKLVEGKLWKDSKGDSCFMYEWGRYCTRFGEFGELWHDIKGGQFSAFAGASNMSALEACCVCGGGSQPHTTTTTTTTTNTKPLPDVDQTS